MKKLFTLFCLLALATASYATSFVYDFEALLSGGYTTINSSGLKNFEGKNLNVISSFANAGGDVGVNVNGRIAALYQSGNGSNFWFRDASRPWFVSAAKTSHMAFDDLKAGDVVKIIGDVSPLTILCDNVEGYEKGTTFEATYTEDTPLELVAKADGYIYGSYGDYTAIKKIIVESSAAEAASDPIITVTAAKDAERTVTIDANIGSAGTAQTAYYTLDGSEPTNASTEYTAPFTVSETTTVKAVAYCGEMASNVVTLEVEAGFAIKLNNVVLGINAMQAKESQFAPVYGVSTDNSQLIGAPTATLSASFLGKDVTADLLAGTFIPSANGKLIVTSSAEGYESSTVKEVVYSTYNQTYASADYSTLTDEASVQNALGTEWSKNEPTRWANWNKNNSIYGDKYNVYSYTGEAEGNIYLDKDNMLRGPKAIQFMERFGFGRGVSGATQVYISETGTPQDITLYRVINSKGLDENTYTETFVKSADNIIYGNSYSEFNIPGCETLCQVTIYSPEVQSTYTAKFINTKDWEKVYVWTWNEEGNLYAEWPGEEITKTSKQVDGHDVYVWTYTGDFIPGYIIFNNGVEQTSDFGFVNKGIYNFDGFVKIDDGSVVEPAFPDGTYYMENAYTGKKVAAKGLNNLGTRITFAFDENAGYTITGSDLFAGKTWIAEGDGIFTFYTLVDGVKKYAAVDGDNFVLIEDGTAESAYWILLNPGYWESTLSYNVAGTADLCGTAWDTSTNEMTKNSETGLYEWTAKNITVSSEIVPAFKIAVNSTDDMGSAETVAWYPEGENWFITTGVTGGEGVFDITITFNNVTKEIGVKAVKAGEEEASYYLIGSMTSWSTSEEYKLTLNEKAPEGIEEYMIVVDLAADAQFKVVKDNGEDKTWYPDGMGNNFGENGEIPEAGIYTVYFRPNGDGGSDWFYNVIYIEPYVPQAYELYVAGVQVTDLNAKDILDDGGTFTYNTKTKTLTINDSYTYDDWFLIRNAEVEDLTIYVANDVELRAGIPDFTFYLWKSTTITGPGKLTLYGNIVAVFGSQLTIEDANIDLPQTTSYAIQGNLEGESLLIRNSNIHARSYYQGIANFVGGITIEDGMLDESLRISDYGTYICKTDGSDADEVIIYDLENATGINRLSPTPSFSKSEIFNLAGQRLNKMQKGINIVGGKKTIR